MYKFVLLIFLVSASCGTQNSVSTTATGTSETSTPITNGELTFALGEETNLGGMVIAFSEVLEDSRCPTGTQCFWEGRARLLVEMSGDGMTVEQQEIIFGKLKPGESHNHTFYKDGTTTITAKAINPYPTAETGTTGLAYKLVIMVATE
jgi:hypothetical protein|tara:strand:+ start:21442 stop:21888 length:447 start_codon:yes stop_codon:yes gene_type:complete